MVRSTLRWRLVVLALLLGSEPPRHGPVDREEEHQRDQRAREACGDVDPVAAQEPAHLGGEAGVVAVEPRESLLDDVGRPAGLTGRPASYFGGLGPA